MKWSNEKLGDVCEAIAGQSPPSSTYNNKETGLPFFQGKADFGKHFPKVRMWCDQPNKIAEPNDILLSVRAPVGPTNICDVKSCIGRGLAAIRSNGKTFYKYIYYYFKFIEGRLSKSGNGSTFSAITIVDVKELEIPVPEIKVQQRIALILDTADDLRQKDQQIVRELEELLQSIFHQMFGDVITNSKGWSAKKLGELCLIRRGASPRPISAFEGGNVPWIKIGDGTKGSNIYIEKTAVSITEEGAKKSVYLEPGSLIFANCGVSLGFARILSISGCIHDGWLSLEKVDERELNKIFLLKLINSITHHLRRIAPDGTQPNLNTGIMKELVIPIPDIKLQEKFEKIVVQIEEIKAIAKRQADYSESLFQSLLQKAFRGELVK